MRIKLFFTIFLVTAAVTGCSGNGGAPAEPAGGAPDHDDRGYGNTCYIAIEAEGYDNVSSYIRTTTEVYHGGTVESSGVSVYAEADGAELRNGWLTLRVPAENFAAVENAVLALGKVTERSESDDSDLNGNKYVFYRSLADAKEAEAESLGAFVTGNADEMIMIERRLAELRPEIDYLRGRLAEMDGNSGYALISVYIREIAPTEGFDIAGYGSTVLNGFTGSFKAIVWFFQNGLVLTASVVLPAVLLVALFFFGKWAFGKIIEYRDK